MSYSFENAEQAREDFFRDQVSEAWSHYRHCETMRADYLKMFFTGYLAATGFIVTLFKPDNRGQALSGGLLLAIAILLVVVFCFSSIFYILVIRLNMVLAHYARIMERTRLYFFGSEGVAAESWSYKDIGLHPRKAGFFSISGSVPHLIVFLIGCLVLAQTSIGVALARGPYHQPWRSTLVILTSIAMAVSLVWLYRRGGLAIAESFKKG